MSSVILTQFFVLNLIRLFDDTLFLDIPLLYYCINLRLAIIFCLSSEDIYLPLGISLSFLNYSAATFFVILSPVTCAVF